MENLAIRRIEFTTPGLEPNMMPTCCQQFSIAAFEKLLGSMYLYMIELQCAIFSSFVVIRSRVQFTYAAETLRNLASTYTTRKFLQNLNHAIFIPHRCRLK